MWNLQLKLIYICILSFCLLIICIYSIIVIENTICNNEKIMLIKFLKNRFSISLLLYKNNSLSLARSEILYYYYYYYFFFYYLIVRCILCVGRKLVFFLFFEIINYYYFITKQRVLLRFVFFLHSLHVCV